MFAVLCEKVPPSAPRVITKSGSINVPAATGFVVRTVPPFTVIVAPLCEVSRELLSVLRVAPGLSAAKPVYRDFRAGDVRHSLANIDKARNLLGFSPTVRIGEGLDLAMEWYSQEA